MAIVFEQDATKKEVYSYNPDTDQHHFTVTQDVSGLLDYLKKKRDATPEHGRVEEFAHYCDIPSTVIIELKNKGIDIFNPHQTKELLREINTNYKWLKATTKHHA